MHYVNDHRIPLEVCLSSNVQTARGAAASRSTRSATTSARACASRSTPTTG